LGRGFPSAYGYVCTFEMFLTTSFYLRRCPPQLGTKYGTTSEC